MAFALVLAMTAGIGCGSTEVQLRDTLARAEQYRQDGNFQAELIELRAALKLEPTNANTNLLLAKFHHRTEQLEDARFFYREAYRLDPELHEAGVALADLMKFEDLEAANEIVDAILAKEPGNANANRERAELALVGKDLPGALTAALTAVELAPDDPRAQFTLGRVHQARIVDVRRVKREAVAPEIFEAAIGAFKRAEEGFGTEGTEHLQTIVEQARVYATWPGHQEEAKDAYRRLYELSKDEHSAYQYRAAALALKYATDLGDEDFYRWGLQRMVDVQPEAVNNWRRLAVAMDEFDGTGDAVYERLFSERPDWIEAHESYADFLVAKGAGDQAIAHLEEVSSQGSLDRARLRKKLAFIHLDLRDKKSAEEVVAALVAEAPEDPSSMVAQARMHLIDYQFDEARALLDRVNAGGGDPEALLYLAKLERSLGDTGAAIRALDRSQELSPALWPERVRERIRAASQSGDHTRVDQLIQGLIDLGIAPTIPDQLLWADALYGLGRKAEGRFILRRLLKKGNRLTLPIAFARHEGRDHPEEARQYFEEALERRPNNRRLLVTFARFEASQQNSDRALELLDRAIAQGGRLAPARTLRARLLASKGEWEKAEEDAFEAFQINPRVPGLGQLLVRIYAQRGKLDEVVASLLEADAAGGLSPDARALLGMLQVRAGDVAGALESLEQAVASGAADPMAKNNLAYLLAEQKQDLNRALELAQQALDDLGDSATVTDTIGYIYHQRGLHESAVTMLKAALELAEIEGSPSADIRYHLGLALDALGRTEDAVAEYQAALDLDPDFYASKDARAALEKARGAL